VNVNSSLRIAANHRGMTLIEIMVVIAIIGILSTAIGVGVVNFMQKAKVDSAKAQLRTVANGIDLYAAENDFPTDLREVLEKKLVQEKQLQDPWKQDLIYNYPASRNSDNQYDLCSKGPDKVEGSEDDICNN
jgi:general secretion pathway protein G